MTEARNPLHFLLSTPLRPCIGCGAPSTIDDGEGVHLCDEHAGVVDRFMRGEDISESAGRSAVATAGAEVVPQPMASVVALPPETSAASSGVADFSDRDPDISELERAWLLQPGASELPAMRNRVTASRTLAAKASVSKSISLVKA